LYGRATDSLPSWRLVALSPAGYGRYQASYQNRGLFRRAAPDDSLYRVATAPYFLLYRRQMKPPNLAKTWNYLYLGYA
jgi:hypothetical protein